MVTALLTARRIAYVRAVMAQHIAHTGTERSRLGAGRAAAILGLVIAVGHVPALAAPSRITVLNPAPLRFGSFAVPTSGYREVTASGAVSGAGIFALGSADAGPARFTLQYDRGNNSKRRMDITVDLVFSTPANFAQGGLTARLSRYQTDLPGYAAIVPGQQVRVELTNCTQRICSISFNLGGRLTVDRTFGGGQVVVPIPVDAVVVSER